MAAFLLEKKFLMESGNMSVFTIDQIEAAINLLLRQEGAEGQRLGKKTRKLADLYGMMIYRRERVIDAGTIEMEQLEILAEALEKNESE